MARKARSETGNDHVVIDHAREACGESEAAPGAEFLWADEDPDRLEHQVRQETTVITMAATGQ